MGKVGWIKYDDYIAERLRDPDQAAGYLSVCFEDPDQGVFLMAFKDVINANGGVAAVARKTGLNRENLYKMLSKSGNPRLESLRLVLRQLGLKLSVDTAPTGKPRAARKKARKRPRDTAKRKRAA